MTQTYEEIINQLKDVIHNQPIPPHYNPDEWENKEFNCYAYALRACMNFNDDVKETGVFPKPSFISLGEENCYRVTKERILTYFKEDCEALGLQVFPTELEEQIGANEYKIAIYVKEDYDFHFARQDSNGKWSEKNGWYSDIEILKQEDVTKDEDGYEFIGIFRVSKK